MARRRINVANKLKGKVSGVMRSIHSSRAYAEKHYSTQPSQYDHQRTFAEEWKTAAEHIIWMIDEIERAGKQRWEIQEWLTKGSGLNKEQLRLLIMGQVPPVPHVKYQVVR
jgi:hypothetical protein